MAVRWLAPLLVNAGGAAVEAGVDPEEGLFDALAARPPGALSGPLGVAQALLVLRFFVLDGELGDRVRRTLDGFVLPAEVDGRRFGSRLSPDELLNPRQPSGGE